MTSILDLRGLLADLAAAGCEFVVIGSSALQLQGWEVRPSDLDLYALPGALEQIKDALGVWPEKAAWVQDGDAKRLECQTNKGPVDIYISVSGRLTYEDVMRDSITVLLGRDALSARVGSLEHVRDMRAAVGRPSLPGRAVPPAARLDAPHVVAIDGPAGAGKSTVSRELAKRLGFTYLNTGAMYRCVTLAVLSSRVDPDDHETIGRIASDAEIEFQEGRVFLDSSDVTDAIRGVDVTKATPHIASYPEVRDAMTHRQRQLFLEGGYVAEGRDTGTVVAPDALLKIFLTASLDERASRRARETGESESVVMESLKRRDHLDSRRKLSALRIAEDAVVLDTTGRSVRDVVDEVEALAVERGVV